MRVPPQQHQWAHLPAPSTPPAHWAVLAVCTPCLQSLALAKRQVFLPEQATYHQVCCTITAIHFSLQFSHQLKTGCRAAQAGLCLLCCSVTSVRKKGGKYLLQTASSWLRASLLNAAEDLIAVMVKMSLAPAPSSCSRSVPNHAW